MARKRSAIGSVVIAVVLVGATALIAANFTSLTELAHTLATASWPWVLGGVVIHVGYFIAYAMLYRLGFWIVGVESRTRALVPLVLAGMFVNIVVPTGAGSAALFIDDAARRGQSGASAAVGVVLVLLLDLVTLIPFVGWAVWFLVSAGLFSVWAIVATVVFVLYLTGLVVLLALARARQPTVCRALGWVRRVVGRIAGRFDKHDLIDEDWPARTASRFGTAAAAIGTGWRRLAIAALWAIVLHLINLAGLWMFVRGFGEHVSLGGLVAAFAIAIVFFVVAVIPQAAPVVEAIMMAIFVQEGVAAARAVAATLAFRAVNLWLPLVIGLGFASRIRRFGQRPEGT